jgi:hypothetical protein
MRASSLRNRLYADKGIGRHLRGSSLPTVCHIYGTRVWLSVMKTTLNLDSDLLREAKKRAAEEGITLTRVVEDALRSALTERPATERFRLRLKVVDGGPPLVDVADRDALYERMEGRS